MKLAVYVSEPAAVVLAKKGTAELAVLDEQTVQGQMVLVRRLQAEIEVPPEVEQQKA
jgi:hypothetical protein